jgi:hypothetical protein
MKPRLLERPRGARRNVAADESDRRHASARLRAMPARRAP